MTPLFNLICDGFIPGEMAHRPEELRQARRTIAFHLAMLIWVPVFGLVYYSLGATISSNIVLSGGVLLLGNLQLLRRGWSLKTCGNILCCIAWYVYTSLAVLTGGAIAPVMVWYASVPVLSVLLTGTRWGVGWTATSVLTITGFAIARELGVEWMMEVSPAGMRFLQYSGVVGLICCVFVLVCVLKGVEYSAREALHEANHRLELQASIDCLTGIANRRTFDGVFEREWKRHARAGVPLSIALIDADFFKQYNDICGHLAGDDCLRLIAEAIEAAVRRPGDFAARFGGEEFSVILPETNEAGAMRITQAIQQRVRELGIPHPSSPVCGCVTVSIGSATSIPTSQDSHQAFLKEADTALYRAKANGRNQCVHCQSLVVV